MSVLDELKSERFSIEFLEYKASGKNMSSYEEKDLQKFISNAEYLPIVENIAANHPFPLPQLRELNKKNTNKKRTVFFFER